MNILIATFSFPSPDKSVYDGKFVLSEAISYANAGAKVRVVTPHFDGVSPLEQLGKNITVFRYRYFFPESLQMLKRPGVPLYDRRPFLALCQIPFLCLFFSIAILRHALWADMIHSQWTLSALLALPAKWFLGKKIVVTARGTDLRRIPRWINRFIHRQVSAAIDCFGPQPWNDRYKKTFSANYIRLPLIVHNSTSDTIPEDMEKWVSKKDNPFVILYVGRFNAVKISNDKLPMFGLIQSAMILRDNGWCFHLFYVGDGDEKIKNNMLKLIRENGLHDHVTLLGGKVNVMDYMRFCDLGVGGIAFNAVSQEFTVLGIPQILVDVPDNRNTPWKHGNTAIFVRPDDESDLANKLSWGITHRNELEQIGKNAKEEMKQYIVETKLGGRLYLEAFERLLDNN